MNDSNSMLRFRESFRGYNKDDVNAYIEQVNARFSRRESDLRAQIADLQNRMPAPAANTADDGTKKRLEAAETENAKLKAELEELKNSAAGNSEKYNMMTASWGFAGEMWGNDCMMTVIRPQRYTMEFINNSDYFTLSFYGDNKDIHKICGSKSGRDTDKAKLAKLTPVFSDNTVYFEEARLVII